MDNRELLIREGLELFAAKGYAGVGVQEICQAAGVTKPTLYHYFGSKLGLYQAIFETIGTPFLQMIGEKTEYHNDLTRNLNEIAIALMEMLCANPLFFRFLENARTLTDASEHFPAANAFLSAMTEPIFQMFIKAEAQHGNMRGKAHLLTYTFIGMLFSIIRLIQAGHMQYSTELPYRVVHQFMYGIFS